ncbi:MAG: hypothetical protein M3R59_01920 [Verrucomicrobiota bacterium]|nr:hypothetical protein [Verrucomicrobiota bacterium]
MMRGITGAADSTAGSGFGTGGGGGTGAAGIGGKGFCDIGGRGTGALPALGGGGTSGAIGRGGRPFPEGRGGRLIREASLLSAAPPGRRGGSVMRTVSFFGSLLSGMAGKCGGKSNVPNPANFVTAQYGKMRKICA